MPIIAISRGAFTAGQNVAECLAKRLGYRCLSREVVIDAAASYGVPVERFVDAMERPPSFWERLTGERSLYLHYLRSALAERALEGKVVYHGYAGHLLLPGISHVLRVRVVADAEARIASAMEHQHLDRRGAAEYIRRVDRQRAEWTRFLYGVDWQDATGYDLVVNASRLGTESACDLIAEAADLEAFRPTPESTQAMQDLVLASHVWTKLASAPETAGAQVDVTSRNGVLEITGSALSWDTLEAIARIASEVEGVKEVNCDVRVTTLREGPL